MKNSEIHDNFTYIKSAYNSIEDKTYSCKILERVIKGIPDIIGVYTSDRTIMFYNQAGYDFYKATKDDISGKKCYEMLCRKEVCWDCPFDTALITKQIVKQERYISELNKYVECYCNPVMDELGEVLFIVEQLRDISRKKYLEGLLTDSANNYRRIVDLCPDAIIIFIDGIIVLANKQTYKYFSNPIGEKIERFATPKFKEIMQKRISQILEKRTRKTTCDYQLINQHNNVIDVEITSSYFTYRGEPAILSLIRDISERKRELNSAANFQRQVLETAFPIPNKAEMETLYIPAKTVSGDFYFLHKISENFVVGILGDVSGKGVSAALSISAFNVLFHEAILVSHNPLDIVNILNNKVGNYLGERYIAACCFSFDFTRNEVRVVGAGINQFVFHGNECIENIVKGPFLGMFEDGVFEEQIIQFRSKDRFYFYTDGLEQVFLDSEISKKINKAATIFEFRNLLNDMISNMLTDVERLNDDFTLLALEIK